METINTVIKAIQIEFTEKRRDLCPPHFDVIVELLDYPELIKLEVDANKVRGGILVFAQELNLLLRELGINISPDSYEKTRVSRLTDMNPDFKGFNKTGLQG